jgi:hypothetical protein
MRRVDRERRQHREDRLHEALIEPDAFFCADLLNPDHRDAGGAHLGAQARPDALLLGHQRLGAAVDRRELLGGRAALLARRRHTLAHLPLQAGDAHHVELVEIVRRDRQEAQPLEQRMHGALRLAEDALVEREPRQLAIDEALLVDECSERGGDRALAGNGLGGHGEDLLLGAAIPYDLAGLVLQPRYRKMTRK